MYESIANYLKYKDIALLYDWGFKEEIPEEKFGIRVEGSNWLEKTISLRNQLREYIRANPDRKVSVADYYIKEWGGIRRFDQSQQTVSYFSCYEDSEERPKDFRPNFSSVSSWSKWASLVCPKWACIYDARVAYSINAINYLSNGEGKIFPAPNGRNTRLGILDVETLLLSNKLRPSDKNNPKAIKKSYYLASGDAYIRYLDLLVAVSKELWKDCNHIHEVEMLLFALADKNIYAEVFAKVSEKNGI